MIPIKIFVAIILTKLQRFESGAIVKRKITCAAQVRYNLQSAADSTSPYMVKTDVIFKVCIEFYL